MGTSLTRATLSVVTASVLLTACGGDDGPDQASNAPQPGADAPGGDAPGGDAPDNDRSGVANSAPTIGGKPQAMVRPNTKYVFEPEASDHDGDILHFSVTNAPAWAEFEPVTGRLEGTPGSGDLGTYEGIVIGVTDGAADAELEPFSITVTATAAGAIELSWSAPEKNSDGTPLTDLAGYKIYYGTEPGEYTESVTIDNPGIVTYVLEDLVPATYYFVATAYNAEGTESEPSDMASETVS